VVSAGWCGDADTQVPKCEGPGAPSTQLKQLPVGIVAALSEIQWSIRYAQDDESWGGAEECGRPFGFAQGRYPTLCKERKG